METVKIELNGSFIAGKYNIWSKNLQWMCSVVEKKGQWTSQNVNKKKATEEKKERK